MNSHDTEALAIEVADAMSEGVCMRIPRHVPTQYTKSGVCVWCLVRRLNKEHGEMRVALEDVQHAAAVLKPGSDWYQTRASQALSSVRGSEQAAFVAWKDRKR